MNKSIKNNAQAGFTLIELIVVIVILGILAATALPKFTSLGGEARFASLQAAKGALSATASMAKGKYLVNTGAALTELDMEGAKIQFVAGNGYPQANAMLAKAAGLDTDYQVVGANQPATSSLAKTEVGQIMIVPASLKGSPTGLNCYLTYTAPTTANQAPTYTIKGSATDCE